MQQSKSRMIISIIDSVIVLSIMAVIIVSMSLKHNVFRKMPKQLMLCSQFVRICWINCLEWNMRLFPCKLPIRSLLWLWPVPIWNTRAAAICGRFCLWRCSTAKLRPRFMTLSLHTNANKA